MEKTIKGFRATFEDTLKFQEDLRRKLDYLVEENRSLRPDERRIFLELVNRALLGQGIYTPLEQKIGGVAGIRLFGKDLLDCVVIENCEDLLRFLAYYEVGKTEWGGGKSTTIGDLWKRARQLVFKTFPIALIRATQISPEHIPYEPTVATEFSDDKKPT